MFAERSRYFARIAAAICRAHSDSWRVSRASGDRPGIWRQGRSCEDADARQGVAGRAHRVGRVCKPAESVYSAARYHSLAVERSSLPACLEVTAWTDDGEIMGLRHRTLAVEGVQFHPESIATEHGHAMLKNFLQMSEKVACR